jgi:hypothetical protein
MKQVLDALPERGRDLYAWKRPSLGGELPDPDSLGSRYDEEVGLWVDAYKDPAFPWHYVKYLVKKNLPLPKFLPADEDGMLLRRAFWHESGRNKDSLIFAASVLNHRRMRWEREIIQALLLARDVTVQEACKRTGLNAEAVCTYEKLFFNVLDRADDGLFVTNLVYPDGRIPEFFDNYTDNASLGSLLKRAGFRNGLEDVLFMSGHKESDVAFNQAAESNNSPGKLEATLMTLGWMLAKNGFAGVSGRKVPVLAAARGMINAARAAGGDSNSGGGGLNAEMITRNLMPSLMDFVRNESAAANRLRTARSIEREQALMNISPSPTNEIATKAI